MKVGKGVSENPPGLPPRTLDRILLEGVNLASSFPIFIYQTLSPHEITALRVNLI